ncbi:bifunctional riboflavin kinase/FAD synthetase [Amphibacillus sediminis]|uniref:bifunctional riboflavin kinase/FAD synthetase n=1 Tax=Amphibacillus sediminis TaxID=360185 RepID=UPI00082D31AA|nr:bifunctional riboflavin kinase/FAD synthetase [Amphibacillus sediminis]
MQKIQLDFQHQYIPKTEDSSVCAIGFFDGIHQGHQKVIQTAKQLAEQSNQKLAVMSFTPHPSAILKKDKARITYLTPLEQKEAILAELGVDILYLVHFDLNLAKLAPQAFINHFIVDLNINHLVCGFDFTYGHMGKGNINTLDQHARGHFQVTIVEKHTVNQEKVSSTRIRHLLAEGKVDIAKQLLTRPLTTKGSVISGYKRGRLIGFPTANLKIDPSQALPRTGVYYVTVQAKNQCLHGMANLGYNPTFVSDEADNDVKLEVHILDFDGDLYDETISIHWQNFIRPEYKFDSVDTLIERIKQDEVEIRQLFSRNTN